MADEPRPVWGDCDECDRWAEIRRPVRRQGSILMICRECALLSRLRVARAVYPAAAAREKIEGREKQR